MARFEEWSTIEIPQFLAHLGFEDRSYHNDLCARMERRLREPEEGPNVIVWVEHENPTDRENPTDYRYMVQVCMNDEDYLAGEGYVLGTEDEMQVTAVINKAIAAENDGDLYHWITGNSAVIYPLFTGEVKQ